MGNQEIEMRTNTETLNKDASTNMLSALEDLKKLISELEHPKYRDLIRFAVAWQGFDTKLTALELAVSKKVTEKQISPIDEVLKKLIMTN